MRRVIHLTSYAVVSAIVAAGAFATGTRGDWRNASRESTGLAPDPAVVKEAVVQVYGARTIGAKGLFGVHTWVAVKPTDATQWTVYEVVGWRLGTRPARSSWAARYRTGVGTVRYRSSMPTGADRASTSSSRASTRL